MGQSMSFLKMDMLDLKNKRLLIRADLNVAMQAGKITNDARLRAALPSIQLALKKGAAVILVSHLGRPKAGEVSSEFSLQPVRERLELLLGHSIRFEKNWIAGLKISPGEVVLCENVRFLPGEAENDPLLAQKMAMLCDIFIMDAFGTAHRAQASTEGIIKYAPIASAGLLLEKELDALNKIFAQPKHPLVAIVGGAKVSTKLQLLQALLERVDALIVGGGIANTFIKAQGYPIGSSLFEPNFVEQAKELIIQAKKQNKALMIPEDVVTAKEISESIPGTIKNLLEIEASDKILDVGPATVKKYTETILKANTIIWNGPLGMFEYTPFSAGTQAIARAIAISPGFSVAGGGETLAAIDKFNVSDKISYISTGGAAFLEFLEGKSLPAIIALEMRCKDNAG